MGHPGGPCWSLGTLQGMGVRAVGHMHILGKEHHSGWATPTFPHKGSSVTILDCSQGQGCLWGVQGPVCISSLIRSV